MDITSSIFTNKNLVTSYRKGSFLINGQEYFGSIVIFPEKIIKLNEADINNYENFEQFLTEEIEILLIGTGKTRNIPNSSVKSYLMKQKWLNFEFMTTDAACRTHNILVYEERSVVTYLVSI